MDHSNHAITDKPGKINTPLKSLDLRAVLDVSASPDHANGDVGDKSVCFLWWYMRSGSTQSTMIDASIAKRVWPLVKSGYVARNMHEWLERVRRQYQDDQEPDPKAGLRLKPHTNWRKICGRTKTEVVTEILMGLAERLERGEITPAPKRRGRLAKDLESVSGRGDL